MANDCDRANPMESLRDLAVCRRWLRAQGQVLDGDLGELSRFGALKMALSAARTNLAAIGSSCLIDHSVQKSGGTEEMFGRRLEAVSPYWCFRGLGVRLLVIWSMFCTRRLQRELVAIAVAESLRRQVDDTFETYLWNPYNLVGFALAELMPNVHVYVLAPEYPPARQALAVYSNSTILDIQAIEQDRRRPVVRKHQFSQSDLKFVFYLSAASMVESDAFEEAVLIELFEALRDSAKVPVEVRLHYHDLEFGIPESLEARIGTSIVRDGRLSLEALSTRQVSFSCQSSIGYELLGLGVSHIIIGPRAGGSRQRQATPSLNHWYSVTSAVLPWELVPNGWADRLMAAYPDRVSRAGENLLLDGHRIASW